MKLADVRGRAALGIGPRLGFDVHAASGGRFGPHLPAVHRAWEAFAASASGASTAGAAPFRRDELGAPSPEPGQIVALGLNYRAHAGESGFDAPEGLATVEVESVRWVPLEKVEQLDFHPGLRAAWQRLCELLHSGRASRDTTTR